MARQNGVRESERYHVRAILRALDILECFSPRQPLLSLQEISEAVGLNPSTTFRLLTTLASRQYIEQDPTTGRYHVGVGILGPTRTFLAHLNLRERVYPLLVRLRDESLETVHLTILDRATMEVVYLEKLEGLRPIGLMSSRIGGRSPGYCTAVGKALLACQDPVEVQAFFEENGFVQFTRNTITSVDALMEELATIRKQGYAIDNAEHEEGVMCVAVPVWDHANCAVAAISVSGPVERISRAVCEENLIKRVVQVGCEASRLMGCTIKEGER